MRPYMIQLYPIESQTNMNWKRTTHRCRIVGIPLVCEVFVEADYRYSSSCSGTALEP